MHSNWNESIDARTWMPLGSWNSFPSGNRDDFQSRRIPSGIHNTVNTDENKENRRPSRSQDASSVSFRSGESSFGEPNFMRNQELLEQIPAAEDERMINPDSFGYCSYGDGQVGELASGIFPTASG